MWVFLVGLFCLAEQWFSNYKTQILEVNYLCDLEDSSCNESTVQKKEKGYGNSSANHLNTVS